MHKAALKMDETVVKGPKGGARRKSASHSPRISAFFITLPDGRRKRIPIGPLTRKALGIVRLPRGKDYRELYEEAICEKYGISK